MTLKRVTYIAGPFDGQYVQHDATLIDQFNLMYIDVEGTLWIESCKAVDQCPDLYTAGRYGGYILAQNVTRGDIVIHELAAKLKEMTALDFLTKKLMQSGCDFELELVKYHLE
ncbi:hypothetical protein [Paenibacillus sp. PAMC21692]|uniref:hypothetical protein n=1 Tax=Paenibacillus sp. PAMC21692 TaxID=2762320 RepID=UPI00164E8C47|nr:hypothetical protein [Paenibacillus sp. PAMC21692]QNK54545.1 hypothetical protein H7F31_17945 [Paenibacillus sp. PAMC21692]